MLSSQDIKDLVQNYKEDDTIKYTDAAVMNARNPYTKIYRLAKNKNLLYEQFDKLLRRLPKHYLTDITNITEKTLQDFIDKIDSTEIPPPPPSPPPPPPPHRVLFSDDLIIPYEDGELPIDHIPIPFTVQQIERKKKMTDIGTLETQASKFITDDRFIQASENFYKSYILNVYFITGDEPNSQYALFKGTRRSAFEAVTSVLSSSDPFFSVFEHLHNMQEKIFSEKTKKDEIYSANYLKEHLNPFQNCILCPTLPYDSIRYDVTIYLTSRLIFEEGFFKFPETFTSDPIFSQHYEKTFHKLFHPNDFIETKTDEETKQFTFNVRLPSCDRPIQFRTMSDEQLEQCRFMFGREGIPTIGQLEKTFLDQIAQFMSYYVYVYMIIQQYGIELYRRIIGLCKSILVEKDPDQKYELSGQLYSLIMNTSSSLETLKGSDRDQLNSFLQTLTQSHLQDHHFLNYLINYYTYLITFLTSYLFVIEYFFKHYLELLLLNPFLFYFMINSNQNNIKLYIFDNNEISKEKRKINSILYNIKYCGVYLLLCFILHMAKNFIDTGKYCTENFTLVVVPSEKDKHRRVEIPIDCSSSYFIIVRNEFVQRSIAFIGDYIRHINRNNMDVPEKLNQYMSSFIDCILSIICNDSEPQSLLVFLLLLNMSVISHFGDIFSIVSYDDKEGPQYQREDMYKYGLSQYFQLINPSEKTSLYYGSMCQKRTHKPINRREDSNKFINQIELMRMLFYFLSKIFNDRMICDPNTAFPLRDRRKIVEIKLFSELLLANFTKVIFDSIYMPQLISYERKQLEKLHGFFPKILDDPSVILGYKKFVIQYLLNETFKNNIVHYALLLSIDFHTSLDRMLQFDDHQRIHSLYDGRFFADVVLEDAETEILEQMKMVTVTQLEDPSQDDLRRQDEVQQQRPDDSHQVTPKQDQLQPVVDLRQDPSRGDLSRYITNLHFQQQPDILSHSYQAMQRRNLKVLPKESKDIFRRIRERLKDDAKKIGLLENLYDELRTPYSMGDDRERFIYIFKYRLIVILDYANLFYALAEKESFPQLEMSSIQWSVEQKSEFLRQNRSIICAHIYETQCRRLGVYPNEIYWVFVCQGFRRDSDSLIQFYSSSRSHSVEGRRGSVKGRRGSVEGRRGSVKDSRGSVEGRRGRDRRGSEGGGDEETDERELVPKGFDIIVSCFDLDLTTRQKIYCHQNEWFVKRKEDGTMRCTNPMDDLIFLWISRLIEKLSDKVNQNFIECYKQRMGILGGNKKLIRKDNEYLKDFTTKLLSISLDRFSDWNI